MGYIVVLGMFDGVHTGHEALFDIAREIQERTRLCICVCTFKNHPIELITGEKVPLLMTVKEREERMKALGADEVVFDDFTESIRDMDCTGFVKMIKSRFDANYVIAGYNYTFGRGGTGDAQLLKSLGEKNAICVEIVQKVMYNGEAVSSSRIRNAIKSGDITQANEMLHTHFCISGIVEYGRQVGRQLGYPTANIRNTEGKVLPKMGVYASYVHIDGKTYKGITNVGTNPTFGEFDTSIETHILDFDEDIYGKRITVSFLSFVREQKKFSGMTELKEQIDADTKKVREYFEHIKKRSASSAD